MAKNSAALAKLTRPQLSGILSRQRLFNLLDQGREKPIIWVSGSPGSGKTTLVADYLDTWARESLWYQVDPGDADVATFFYYMAKAVPRTGDDVTPLPLFTSEYQNNLSAFSRRYFRELFARLTPPFALVFDNYHEVPDQSRFHEVLRDGLAEIPAGGCVLFISRRGPPTAMARFRANQMMEVLDPDDLKLSRAESDGLVKLRGHKLSAQALKQLYEKTRGWAAGLVLLLGRDDGGASSPEPTGDLTPQVVFDYLAGEIFDCLDEDNRNLLLKTAPLGQFTAEMADVLSGRNDSEALFDRFVKDDYFVNALQGGDATIYQYHPLLREFLLRRGEEELSAHERSSLQNRSAELLESAGQIEDTVALRIVGRDWDELARLINVHAETLLAQGRGQTVEAWLEELPIARLRKNPWMLRWLAACRLPVAPRESRRLYEQAYELFAADKTPDLEGLFSTLAGIMYAILNDLDDLTLLDRWISESLRLNKAGIPFPTRAVEARVTCYTFMSMVFRQPFHPDIEAWSERTAALVAAELEPRQLAEVSIIIAASSIWTGRFHCAEESLHNLRRLVAYPDIPMVIRAILHNVEANYFMLIGDYTACMAAVDSGLELAETTGITIWRNRTIIFGIGAALGAGEIEVADELAARLDQQTLARRRFDSCLFHYFRGWQAALQNVVLLAYQNARSALRTAREIGLPFFEILCGLAVARTLVACGDQRKARRILKEIRTVGIRIRNRLLEYMSFIAFALITLDVGRHRSARTALRYALSIGREKGYAHMLWWQSNDMARLCVFALESDIETDYVHSLIDKHGLVPEQPPYHLHNWPWPFTVRTLGGFELERRGQQSILSGRARGRPIEVLKVTLAMGGKNVGVDRITDALWPNIDRDYAHRSFNTTLHRLRKLLGQDAAVTLTDNQLSLSERYFWVDTWVFEQTLEKLRGQMRQPNPDPKELVALTETLLLLYRGGFLPADEDAAWAVSYREQLRNKYVRLINEVGHWLESAGRYDDAVDLYYRGLEADEVAESLYCHIMLCCEQIGRRAEAIDTYNRCCKTLESRLHVTPSRETVEIYEHLIK
jgi:LuxR family maltose regulon positive regulatory protein